MTRFNFFPAGPKIRPANPSNKKLIWSGLTRMSGVRAQTVIAISRMCWLLVVVYFALHLLHWSYCSCVWISSTLLSSHFIRAVMELCGTLVVLIGHLASCRPLFAIMWQSLPWPHAARRPRLGTGSKFPYSRFHHCSQVCHRWCSPFTGL